MFAARPGLAGLLKEGGKQLSGVNEVALKNIDACRNLATITQTSLGPNCMNKLLVNHLDKQTVTSDASVMLNEMDVQHPAAKMLAMASAMQNTEFGDATNLVLVFGGELLAQAELLLRQGIHIADIVQGYELAQQICLDKLQQQCCWQLHNILDVKELSAAIRSTLSSKQFGMEGLLAELVAKGAISIMPANPSNFDSDNLRVCKMTGGNMGQSHLIHGMIVPREANGNVKSVKNAKVIVLGCGLELTGTEAKGTVLLSNAQDLLNFAKGEEDQMENVIKEIKESGVNAMVVNGAISDIAQHFCDAYDILTIKVQSKFETRRLCRTLGATALVRLGKPLPEEIGAVASIELQEISSKKVTVIKGGDSKVASIVLRGSTNNALEELERAIEDAVNCVSAVTKSGRFVAGAGAVEMELASQLLNYARAVKGLDQYAVKKFAEALECVPRILAENAGHDSMKAVTALHAAHQQGKKYEGVDVEGVNGITLDAFKAGIYDHLDTKWWAINLATDAILTILRLDHIIVARQAGGPNPRGVGPGDMDD